MTLPDNQLWLVCIDLGEFLRQSGILCLNQESLTNTVKVRAADIFGLQHHCPSS